jgi:Luciferase-like monooxygenase
VVSNCRLIVGIGAGYVEAEFAAAGLPLTGRGERMDDYLRALRALWAMEQPHHEGPFVSFGGIDAHPRPVQRPGPPLVVGGESPAALRRAHTTGNGWYGFYLDPRPPNNASTPCDASLPNTSDQPNSDGSRSRSTPAGTLDSSTVARYAELGVDRLLLLPRPDADADERHRAVPLGSILRNIDSVAEHVDACEGRATTGMRR